MRSHKIEGEGRVRAKQQFDLRDEGGDELTATPCDSRLAPYMTEVV